MKLFEKKNFVKIEKDDLKDARLSSADFSDKMTQKRAFTNVLGARLAIKMLFSKKIEANNVYSLYTIQNVLKDLDIADIYYSNIKIDVRLVFNREEIFIPKSHFQNDLLPDLYLVLELKEDMSGAECLGFFEPKNLNQDNANDDFYFFEENELQDTDNLKTFLGDFVAITKVASSEQDLQIAEELFLTSTDNQISKEDKIFLLKQLRNNKNLREKFVEFENFEIISTKIVKNTEILQDGVLDIVGAQQLFEDDEASTSKHDIKNEVIEEVLSDLINPNEIESEPIEELENELSISEDNDNFMNELLDNEPPKTKDKDNSALSGTIAGTIAGAIAGGAAASAAAGVVSGLAAQESLAKGGAEILSSGLGFAGEALKSSLGTLSEATNAKSTNFDEIEVIEDDSFFSEMTKQETNQEDEDENTFEIADLDDLSETEEPTTIDDEDTLDDLLTEITKEIDTTPQTEAKNETIEQEMPLEEQDAFNELDFDDNFLQAENEELPQFEIDEIQSDETERFDEKEEEEDRVIEAEVEAEAETEVEEENEFSDFLTAEDSEPVTNTEEIDENVLPNFAESEELIPNEELLGGLPELALGFDNVEPDYLKTFQQEEPAFAQEQSNEDEEPKYEELEISQEFITEDDENTVKLESLETASAPENENDEENPYSGGYFLTEPETTIEESQNPELTNEENEFASESDFSNETFDEKEVATTAEDVKTIDAALDNADSVISEVDNFLKNMDFTDEVDAIDDEEIENINLDFLMQGKSSESSDFDTDSTMQEQEIENNSKNNDSLGILFKEDSPQVDDLNIDELFPNGKKIVDLIKKDKKVAIAASVAGIMLVSFIAGGVIISNKNNAPQPQQDMSVMAPNVPTDAMSQDNMNPQQDAQLDMNAQDPNMPLDATGSQMSGQGQGQINKDMSEAVSQAFSSEPINASITKVAWEVPEDLAYNDGFRKYLQIAGKNLKLNLQNDLLLANDMAYSNKVIVELEIAKDGSLRSSNIVSSSGSKQIDRIVLQSVKTTLKYLKMPADELSSDSADVTLIINF